MTPPVRTIIIRCCQELFQSGICPERNWWRTAHSFHLYCAKSQLLLWSAPNKVPAESSQRFRDSLLHYTEHPEKDSSHFFVQDNKRRSVTTTIMLNELPFLNHVWTTICPIPLLYLIIFSIEYVFRVSRFANKQNTCIFGQKTKKRFDNMNNTAKKQQSGVLCPPVVWYVHVTVIMKHSMEPTIMKCWTLKSCQKLNNSDIMLSSSVKLFLTLHVPSFLFCMKSFRICGLEVMV